MAYESERLCKAIEDARAAVAKARFAYSQGGSEEALARAEQALLKANDDYECARSGRIELGRDR
jgi:hypothetical protein